MKYRSEAIQRFKEKYPYWDFSAANTERFGDLWESCGFDDADITLENLETVAEYGLAQGFLYPPIAPEHLSSEELLHQIHCLENSEVHIPDPVEVMPLDDLRDAIDSLNEGDNPVWDGSRWTR